MTERLSYYQQKSIEYADAEAPIKAFLGAAYNGVETEWDYVTEQMSALEAIFSKGISFGALESYSDFSSERDAFADYSQKIEMIFSICDAVLRPLTSDTIGIDETNSGFTSRCGITSSINEL